MGIVMAAEADDEDIPFVDQCHSASASGQTSRANSLNGCEKNTCRIDDSSYFFACGSSPNSVDAINPAPSRYIQYFWKNVFSASCATAPVAGSTGIGGARSGLRCVVSVHERTGRAYPWILTGDLDIMLNGPVGNARGRPREPHVPFRGVPSILTLSASGTDEPVG